VQDDGIIIIWRDKDVIDMGTLRERAGMKGLLILTAVLVTGCGGGGSGSSAASDGSTSNGGSSSNTPPALQSIDITPANASVQVGKSLDLTATGHYSNGTTGPIYPMLWSSTMTSVATVDVSGRVSAMAAGSSTITVTSNEIAGSVTIVVTPGPAAVSYLYSFGLVPSDGTQPNGPLLQASDGNFYGTTRAGGGNSCIDTSDFCGVLFKMTPTGVETVLYAFGASRSDGYWPTAPLIQAADGNLYGTTASGGAYGAGTVFKMTPDGAETVLYSFGSSPSDGVTPAAVIQGRDGNFYGTTASGGANYCDSIPGAGNNCGTVVKITPAGVETVLYSFGASPSDGTEPIAQLVQASDGNLYGTTEIGGAYGLGTVFKVTLDGVETVLYSFGANPLNGSPPQGSVPQGPLIQATDGNLYGTTVQGGPAGCGTVFRITLEGTLSILYGFAGTSALDGYGPAPFLIQGSDENFYGTTISGGAFGPDLHGTAFQISPAGTETVLYSFGPLDANPSDPGAGLIQASDGAFYGVTAYSGGINTGAGTVFKLVTTTH
jgi:uncharacterized repeat protein (TIGR03803 family)